MKDAVGRRLRARKPKQPAVDLEAVQEIVDTFLSAASSDPKLVAGLLAPSAHIRIVDSDERFEARGENATRRLVEELIADTALAGPQVMGYSHPSVPGFTVVAEYEHDGRRHARVFVLVVEGGLITRVGYYRLS